MNINKKVLGNLKRIPLLNQNLGYAYELLNYLRYPLIHDKSSKNKFVIFGTGRSGSTVLVSLLNSNPQIHCDNEIFHRKVFSPKKFLRYRTSLCNREVYGFKLLTYQLGAILEISGTEFLPYLVSQGFNILYLKRQNVLRQAISNIYARQMNQFHEKSNNALAEKQMLNIDLKVLDDWINAIIKQTFEEEQYLSGLEHFKISYEKDLMNPAQQSITMANISKFLNISFVPPKTTFKKILPEEFSSFIKNYDELVAYAKSNNYEHFINS